MKRFKWLDHAGKHDQRCEPPIWLGNRSNGEYYSPQTERDRLVRRLILERADENARRLGMDRRSFLASTMGMATSLWALNVVSCSSENGGAQKASRGGYCLPEEAELDESAACSVLSGGEFIFDGHTHHFDPNGAWRSASDAYRDGYQSFLDQVATNNFPDRTLRPCSGPNSTDCFTREVYLREFFTESDTAMTVLTMWPSVPCMSETEPHCGLLIAHDEFVVTRELINRLAHSERNLTQMGISPSFGLEPMNAMMDQACQAGVSGWKSYTGWGPGGINGGYGKGYKLTDDLGRAFIEKGLALGIPVFCLHKGLRTPALDPMTNDPDDIGPAAQAYPKAKFVVFHSGLFAGTPEGEAAKPEAAYDTQNPAPRGVDILIRSLETAGIGPNQNVYADLGTTWSIVSNDPIQAGHVIGKLLKYVGENNVLWGSDALPAEHAQSQIEKFRAFQIPQELVDAHAYPTLSAELKAKILGLNLAALYGIDPGAKRCAISKDELAQARLMLDEELGPRRFTQRMPHGPRTRQEFLAFLRENRGMPG